MSKKLKKVARPITGELMLDQSGSLDEVAFVIRSEDGGDLTSQEIIDAVSDLLIDEPMFTGETKDVQHYDA